MCTCTCTMYSHVTCTCTICTWIVRVPDCMTLTRQFLLASCCLLYSRYLYYYYHRERYCNPHRENIPRRQGEIHAYMAHVLQDRVVDSVFIRLVIFSLPEYRIFGPLFCPNVSVARAFLSGYLSTYVDCTFYVRVIYSGDTLVNLYVHTCCTCCLVHMYILLVTYVWTVDVHTQPTVVHSRRVFSGMTQHSGHFTQI